MRYAFKNREFDLFRIDDDKSQIRRAVLVHKADKKRVKPDTLTRTGRTRYQKVGHLGYIGDDGVSHNVLTYCKRKRRRFCFYENLAFENVSEPYRRLCVVGDFHADIRSFRYRRKTYFAGGFKS